MLAGCFDAKSQALNPQEASRAIRKKLKYGNVHRQLRALVILRALTENAGKGFQMHWANQELITRLKEMASDVSGRKRPGGWS